MRVVPSFDSIREQLSNADNRVVRLWLNVVANRSDEYRQGKNWVAKDLRNVEQILRYTLRLVVNMRKHYNRLYKCNARP